jgi:hypothetical protein
MKRPPITSGDPVVVRKSSRTFELARLEAAEVGTLRVELAVFADGSSLYIGKRFASRVRALEPAGIYERVTRRDR